jgi:hypothetical protein
MTKFAQEIVFNGTVPVGNTYNASNISVMGGNNSIILHNLGSNPEDKFLGPKITQVIRHFDTVAFAVGAVYVLKRSTKHYIFVGTAAAAAATRTIMTYVHDIATNAISSGTLVTMTFPTGAVTHTLKSIVPIIRNYTTGTVSVSGTAVTGSGSFWKGEQMCVGCRIGFGSTDPNAITTWYEISAIASDTSITLTGSAGTIAGGTSYVIEDFRMSMLTVGSVVGQGGLFLATGLRLENFLSGATIPAAVATPFIRAVYKLNHSTGTTTQTAGVGITLGEYTDWRNEWIYGVDGATTTLKVYKYNIRSNLVALGVAAGNTTLAVANTANTTGVVVTGNMTQFNNGRSANTKHGPGANTDCIYITTATRIIRVPWTSVTDGSSGFVADTMIEVPQGGVASVPATGGILNLDYGALVDKFVIAAYAAPTGRTYVTQYRSDGGQMDSHMMITSTLADGTSGNNPLFPKFATTTIYVWADDGILYVFNNAATTGGGNIYVYGAFGAHWATAAITGNRAILPKITFASTPSRLNRVYIQGVENIITLTELSKQTDSYRIKYRTSGIDDNSGAWLDVSAAGDLSGVAPTTTIQFCIEFRTWTDICVPARLTSLSLVYEADDALPDEYQWNLGDSNTVDGTFGFTQKQVFGSWPKLHTINIYRADNDTLSLTQNNTITLLGEFEFWNGSAWAANTGNNVIGTRRRFRPTGSLPSGVDLYATLNLT